MPTSPTSAQSTRCLLLSAQDIHLDTHSFHLSYGQVHSQLKASALCPFYLGHCAPGSSPGYILPSFWPQLKCHLFTQAFLSTQAKRVLPTPLSITLYPIVTFYCLQSLYHHLELSVQMITIYLHLPTLPSSRQYAPREQGLCLFCLFPVVQC